MVAAGESALGDVYDGEPGIDRALRVQGPGGHVFKLKPELRRRAAQQAAREALAGTSVCDQVSAVIVDGSVEIHVPPSLASDEIGNALSQFAWSWKFTS